MMKADFIRTAVSALLTLCCSVVQAQSFFDGAVDSASKEVMKKAESDIEKYRKGDFTIRFVNKQGKELKNADAVIELFQHQCSFGTNMIGLSKMSDDSKVKQEALKTIPDIFNTVIVTDYWDRNSLGKPGAFESAKQDYDWAVRNGLRMRFHAILYNVPSWIPTDKTLTAKDYWDIIEFRIKDVAANFNGKIPEYDVINEMFTRKSYSSRIRDVNSNFPDFTDPAVAKRIFDLARKHLSDAKLVCLEARPTTVNSREFVQFVRYCKALCDVGGNFDYVGHQAHFFTGGQPFQEGNWLGKDRFTMSGINKALDLLATVGKPVVLTEFSGPSRDNKANQEEQNALWTMSDKENSAWQINFYKLAFSKPYIRELTRWYHVDNLGGRGEDAGIIDTKGNKKQVYYDLKKLIKEDWHTKVNGKTNTLGEITFRGFYGEYTINIKGYKPVKATLYDDNKNVVVVTVESVAP